MGKRLRIAICVLGLAACSDESGVATEVPIVPTTTAERAAPKQRERVASSQDGRRLVAAWRTASDADPDSEETQRLERKIRQDVPGALPALLDVMDDPYVATETYERATALLLLAGAGALPAVCDRIDRGPDARTEDLYALLLLLDPAWTTAPGADRVWRTVCRSFDVWVPDADATAVSFAEDGVYGATRVLDLRGALVPDSVVTMAPTEELHALLPTLRRLGPAAGFASADVAALLRRGPDERPADAIFETLAAMGMSARAAVPDLRAWIARNGDPEGRGAATLRAIRSAR